MDAKKYFHPRLRFSRREPKTVAIFVALAGMLRLLWIGIKPDNVLVMHLPDDAFYYLVPARYFATVGRWTFDGIEPATGFHLLWGYFLAALFRIDPTLSLHGVLAIAGSIQVASLAVAAYLLTRAGVRLFGRGAGWGVAAIFLSASMLLQGGWLMESAFVECLAAAVVECLARERIRSGVMPFAGLILLGWSLEVARSDAGLLAGLLFFMLLVLWRRGTVKHVMPLAGAAVLLGGLLGMCTILLHTHAVSGGWVQASARQKLFWSSLSGRNSLRFVAGTPLNLLQPLHNAVPAFQQLSGGMRLISAVGHAAELLAAVAVGLGAWWAARRGSPLTRSLLVTMLLLIGCYCVFYQHDGAVLDWYVSNFAAPMAVLAGAATSWFMVRAPSAMKGVVVTFGIAGFTCSLLPSFRWQECTYRAGLYLRDHPSSTGQGAFNSGVVGFFAGHPVVNLDGLVNDSILPYAVNGRLAAYMGQRNIAEVFDSSFMFKDKEMKRRGGYTDGKLLSCERSAQDIFKDDPNNVWAGGRLLLYRFDVACLRAAYPAVSGPMPPS